MELSEVSWKIEKDSHRWKWTWKTSDGSGAEGHALTRRGAFDGLWHSIKDTAEKERRQQAEHPDHATEYGGSYEDLVKLKAELAPEP